MPHAKYASLRYMLLLAQLDTSLPRLVRKSNQKKMAMIRAHYAG